MRVLWLQVEKLLSDAMDRVENARQLEPVLQRGNKLLSIVSRPARLLECLEFDPEVIRKLKHINCSQTNFFY